MSTFDSLQTNPAAAGMRGHAERMLGRGELLSGKYRISHVLGAGGMGVIHQAVDTRSGTSVAVKVIHASSAHDPHARARFSREVASLSKVGSEHVAQALDADVLEDGTPYLVMELLDGRDLRRETKLRGPLPVGEAVTYVVQACRGVAVIHENGIVHRDLKPHNLFITNLDGARKIKVLDFGIAKSFDAECTLTTANVAVGTPAYMAPELLRNPRELSPLSDVWSLGIILYEILAGFSPFADAPAPAVILAVLDDPPVPLVSLRSDIPQALDSAIQRALAKNPSERWQSAELFARALLEFAEPEPLIVSAERRAVRAPENPKPIDVGDLRRRHRAELERARERSTARSPARTPVPSLPADLAPTELLPPLWEDRSSLAHSSFVVPAFRASSRSRKATLALAAGLVIATAAWLGFRGVPAGADGIPEQSLTRSVEPRVASAVTTLETQSASSAQPTATTAPLPSSPPREATSSAIDVTRLEPAPVPAMSTPQKGVKPARPPSGATTAARPRSEGGRTPRRRINDDNPLHL